MILLVLRADYWEHDGYAFSLSRLYEVKGQGENHETILRYWKVIICRLAGGFFVSWESWGGPGFAAIDSRLRG